MARTFSPKKEVVCSICRWKGTRAILAKSCPKCGFWHPREDEMSKLHNEYAAELGTMYAKMPKAVLAAIAVSFATQMSGEDALHEACAAILKEWQALYRAGIVPQKPINIGSK